MVLSQCVCVWFSITSFLQVQYFVDSSSGGDDDDDDFEADDSGDDMF